MAQGDIAPALTCYQNFNVPAAGNSHTDSNSSHIIGQTLVAQQVFLSHPTILEMSLMELTNELSKTFDVCLESILTETHQKDNNANNVDIQINKLKASFLGIENQIKDIRMKALSNKELSIQESNRLLKRDIEIKKNTIEKYVTKIEAWEKELPVLKENSRKALANRNDGNDFDSDIAPSAVVEESSMETLIEQTADSTNEQNPEYEQNHSEGDDDEDDDVEFEEV